MITTLEMLGAILLFLAGVWLSAFFSGAETGFYRIGFLRLMIDAHSGDKRARSLMWYTQNPSYFVATTLIGNNVANYVTTVAIGIAVAALFTRQVWWAEIVGTLLFSPLIFLWGELIPKNLYYRAPLTLLRRRTHLFNAFYRLFLPLSLPLIGITKLFERFSRTQNKPLELMLGRSRLVQVLSAGHKEGLLTDVQSRLINGIMQAAGQPVRTAMTPINRVLAMADDSDRRQLLDHARKYGLADVAVHTPDNPSDCHSYLRVADLQISTDPVPSLFRRMRDIDVGAGKLQALLALRQSGDSFARIVSDGEVLGLINERGLSEQMIRGPQTPATSVARA